MPRIEWTRRNFIGAASIGSSIWFLDSVSAQGSEKQKSKADEEEVSPNEDLMREHGVLERILLVYEEGLHRLEDTQDFAPEVVAGGAAIVRRFVEDYHEKLEEDFLFPRFTKAGQLLDLESTGRSTQQDVA